MRLYLLRTVFLLLYLVQNAQGDLPAIVILYPENGTAVSLPLVLKYKSTAACISVLKVDGIAVHGEKLDNENDFMASFRLSDLSSGRHEISAAVADASGLVYHRGLAEHYFEILEGSARSLPGPFHEDDGYHQHLESCEWYNHELSAEDRSKAVLQDGWLLVHQNIEFSRIEPGDSCSDLGWTRRPKQRRIYDAFQFFNELEILEIRLHELDSVVHRFILVEATRTHSNKPKPLHFLAHKRRFARFEHKLIHIIVDDLPNHPDPWVLENFQRNAILRGLVGAHPNDLVVIADVDEIPTPYILDAIRSCDGPTSPAWLYSRFFNFKFSWEFQGQWKHPQVVRVAQLVGSHGPAVTPQQVRMGAMGENYTKIESAGWHCSFFTDVDGVVEKVRAFTHQELNREDWLDKGRIAAAISEGQDYFNADMSGNRNTETRHGGLGANPSCHGLPRHALAHPDRFDHLLPDCAAAHGGDVPPVTLAFPDRIADDYPGVIHHID